MSAVNTWEQAACDFYRKSVAMISLQKQHFTLLVLATCVAPAPDRCSNYKQSCITRNSSFLPAEIIIFAVNNLQGSAIL